MKSEHLKMVKDMAKNIFLINNFIHAALSMSSHKCLDIPETIIQILFRYIRVYLFNKQSPLQ